MDTGVAVFQYYISSICIQNRSGEEMVIIILGKKKIFENNVRDEVLSM